MLGRRDLISLRHHERVVNELLAVIREQNDRLMAMAHSPWPAFYGAGNGEEPELDSEVEYHATQLADDE